MGAFTDLKMLDKAAHGVDSEKKHRQMPEPEWHEMSSICSSNDREASVDRRIDMNKVEKHIKDVLSRDVPGVEILRVHVEDDLSFEDDEILRVEVIFQGKAKDIQPSFLSRAIRKVRPALADFDLMAFPMMSFISEQDAKVATRI